MRRICCEPDHPCPVSYGRFPSLPYPGRCNGTTSNLQARTVASGGVPESHNAHGPYGLIDLVVGVIANSRQEQAPNGTKIATVIDRTTGWGVCQSFNTSELDARACGAQFGRENQLRRRAGGVAARTAIDGSEGRVVEARLASNATFAATLEIIEVIQALRLVMTMSPCRA